MAASSAESSLEQMIMEDPEHEDPTALRQTLEERHMNMIAFSSVVGIGLFLQAGKVVYFAGPGMAVIAYLLTGSIMWSAMACLGEMTALFPVKGAVFEFVCRFVDEGVGYAVGWMGWFFYVMIVATEVTAVSGLFNFQFDPEYLSSIGYPAPTLQWTFGQGTNPALWAGLLLLIIAIFNFLPVRAFGEIEYFIGWSKILFICLLIIFNIIINVHSFDPNLKPNHFKYYDQPYGFSAQNFTVHGHVLTGNIGHLAGTWTAMTTIMFGMAGFDAVAITAAETKNLDRDESVKLATRKIILRVVPLYALAAFVGGLNVPYSDPNLKIYAANSLPNGQHSLFIIAAVRAHRTAIPHFFNAFYIFSATSAGINALYMASRLLHALACSPNAWYGYGVIEVIRSRLQRTVYGVPMVAVTVSWLFGLLGFLAVKPSPAQILGRMATVSVAAALIVYCFIAVAYLRFYHCIKLAAAGKNLLENPEAYNRNNDTIYPYKSHGQWLRAWYALTGALLILMFNGWRSFVSPYNQNDFIASYLIIPIFVFIVILYRIKFEGFNPLNWQRRAEEDLRDPLSIRETNPRLRRGRLRRANKDKLICWENIHRFGTWLREWTI